MTEQSWLSSPCSFATAACHAKTDGGRFSPLGGSIEGLERDAGLDGLAGEIALDVGKGELPASGMFIRRRSANVW